jgi:MFS transporter, DHA1 family, inner membrane transport protein
MALFDNNAVNRLYVHGALHGVAEAGGGAFIFVYLLKSGLSAPLVLCVLAAIACCRFALRPLVLPLAARIGLRRTLMLGIVMSAVSYVLLPQVFAMGRFAPVYLVLSSVGSLIYWTSMHAYTATLGDAAHRGGQISIREAITAAVGVLAPLAGSLALLLLGPQWAFLAVALFEAAGALPFIGAPEVAIDLSKRNSRDTARTAFGLFLADGVSAGFSMFTWQLALFVSLGESFGAYGAAMAAAGLVGAAAALLLGRQIDIGQGERAAQVSFGLSSLIVMARSIGAGAPVTAVGANVLGAVVGPVCYPVMMARVYNLAQASASPLRFHIAGEAGWDIGAALSCLITAGLLALGFPFSVPLMLGLAGAAGLYVQLRASYRKAASLQAT